MSNYTEMIELSSITAEGFGGRDEYRDKVIITVPAECYIDSVIEREIIKFALKYGVEAKMVQVNRDNG